MEPVGETLQPLRLAAVHLRVPVRVVADQDLGEVGVEALDVVAEAVAVLEVELVLAALLDGHGEPESALPGLPRHRPAELLVDQGAGQRGVGAVVGRLEQPLEDQVLGVGDPLDVLGRRVALQAKPLLLERPPVVECQDEELSVVSETHLPAFR